MFCFLFLRLSFLKVFHVINNILIRITTKIRVEEKRKQLKLPRARFKFNIFRKEEKRDFVFKYPPQFKKTNVKILSREISLPVVYQKEMIIKHPVMVKLIAI